jgi:hypothetical protein
MNRLQFPLLLVIAYVAFDLFRTLHTGRARGWLGTITREGQPKRFWRYVYSGWAVLTFFVAAIVWATLWPDSLGRH